MALVVGIAVAVVCLSKGHNVTRKDNRLVLPRVRVVEGGVERKGRQRTGEEVEVAPLRFLLRATL